MIISASRRTDIPAFYSEWFFNRLKEGYVIVGNPYNNGDLSRIPLTPDVVDCIAFRTKNPIPMLDRLDALDGYDYYFQFTINPYEKDIEQNVPSIDERLEAFRVLSQRIGAERMIWRYDPVLISQKYSIEFHAAAFDSLARRLAEITDRCLLGFIIHYPFIAKRMAGLQVQNKEMENTLRIAESFSRSASRYGLRIETCAESADLEHFGIGHGACIDREHIERIVGHKFGKVKESYLRKHCGCMESVDIGCYSTCLNGCLYCYATINKPRLNCDISSPSLDPNFRPEKLSKVKSSEYVSHKLLQLELLGF